MSALWLPPERKLFHTMPGGMGASARPGGSAFQNYINLLISQGATNLWPMNEAPGATTLVDVVGGINLSIGGKPYVLGSASVMPTIGGTSIVTAAGFAALTPNSGDITLPGNFSTSIWSNPLGSAQVPDGAGVFMGRQEPGLNFAEFDVYVPTSGKFAIEMGAANAPGNVTTLTTSAAYADGSPHLWNATYDGSFLKLYVDGVLAGSLAYSGGHYIGSSKFGLLGNDRLSGAFPSNSLIGSSQLGAVFDGVVLTAAQCLAQFNAG